VRQALVPANPAAIQQLLDDGQRACDKTKFPKCHFVFFTFSGILDFRYWYRQAVNSHGKS
jgi:hypothetical protein